MSACEIVHKIKSREISAVEVAKAFIDRINIVNPKINAIHQFDPVRILSEAARKDQEIAEGKKLGKLHGLPISLKDAFYAPGFRGAKGSKNLYESSPLDKCSTVVQRLLDEGAIILGITNVPEFLAAAETDNSLNGRTNNPYNLAKVAGGSSGGEAALIATGGSCVGIGSDAAGSIRTPASYCGIAGLKPTKGLVPYTGNVPKDVGGLHTNLVTVGPMARRCEDLELLLSVIAGPDGIDPDCFPVPLKHSKDVDTSKLRVIYYLDNGIVALEEDVARSINLTLDKLRPHVASLVFVKPPVIIKETYKLVWDTCFLGGTQGSLMSEMFEKIGQADFSPLYSRFIEQAKKSDFDNAELQRRLIEIYQYRREMLQYMSHADILLCPATATAAREHEATHEHLRDVSNEMVFNLTGWPAASINCGFSKTGLPIGIQIAAKSWDDHLVLAVAKRLQGLIEVPKIVNP